MQALCGLPAAFAFRFLAAFCFAVFALPPRRPRVRAAAEALPGGLPTGFFFGLPGGLPTGFFRGLPGLRFTIPLTHPFSSLAESANRSDSSGGYIMRGRKPKSKVLRELSGNAGHRSHNDREPEPPPMPGDEVPPLLMDNPIAIAEWVRLVPMLRRVRQITEADRSALIALCLEWNRYLTVEASAPRNQALQACIKLWAEIGLTPSSRARVRTNETAAPGGDSFSEFDEDPPKATPQVPVPPSDKTH